MRIYRLTLLLILAFVCIAHAEVSPRIWVDDSFDDFSKGTLDASGQNIYVSREGSIRTIQRFDINEDGYIDLFFGNTHDHINRVDPTEITITSDRKFASRRLAVPGSNEIDQADLNNDGWTDLVFTLEKSGLQYARVFLWILYGREDGWTPRRSAVLPANGPLATEIADLNGDGWQDIVVLNRAGGPFTQEETIRIYWGADTGFLLSQYQDIGLPGATALCSADLDNDGVSDLVALCRDTVRVFWGKQSATDAIHALRDGTIAGFWGGSTEGLAIALTQVDITLPTSSARCIAAVDFDSTGIPGLVVGTSDSHFCLVKNSGGREFNDPTMVEGFSAAQLTVSDLDADGHDDLIVTNLAVAGRTTTAGGEMGAVDTSTLSPVRVYWGAADGIAWQQPATLQAPFAIATDIGDLDGDGRLDIAVAAFQETADKRYDSQSLIYFGNADRTFTLSSEHIPTTGATDVAVVTSENGLPGRAVFANRLAGTLYERVPLYVYWGMPGGFDPEHKWSIPGQSGHEATGADLNADGHVDLVMTLTAHGGPPALKNPIVGTNILWGGSKGFDLEAQRTILPEPYMDTSTTADLNRDGYLDLVLGGWDHWYAPEGEKEAYVAIYYGSSDGYSEANKVTLRSEGRSNGVNIADFNRDGWLDISATSRLKSRVRIFWGSPDGFDAERQQWLTVPIAMGTEIADFNADGWLDLIVSSYRDYVNIYNDTGNVIFWGGAEGFQHWNAQWLPGSCTHYQAVADFDGDGYLDVFMPNYHGQYRRGEYPSYLFWGGPEGFDVRRKTNLICDSACGAQTGDFNQDGLIDLAVACHSSFGTHQVDSKVFYNDGNRFTNPKVTRLPTLGAHMMWIQDMGHIYTRKHEQRYTSSVCAWTGAAQTARLAYTAAIPDQARLEFAIRSASTAEELNTTPWRPVTGSTITLRDADRFLQYQATFISENGDRYPVLQKVHIELD